MIALMLMDFQYLIVSGASIVFFSYKLCIQKIKLNRIQNKVLLQFVYLLLINFNNSISHTYSILRSATHQIYFFYKQYLGISYGR